MLKKMELIFTIILTRAFKIANTNAKIPVSWAMVPVNEMPVHKGLQDSLKAYDF